MLSGCDHLLFFSMYFWEVKGLSCDPTFINTRQTTWSVWREKADDWLSGAGGGERKEWEVLV